MATICRTSHGNLGIGIGIGIGIRTNITNVIISTFIRPELMVTQDEETTPYRYRGHLTNKKPYISTFARLMTPKRSKVVTQDEGITLTKSRDTSITWLCDK